MDSSTLGEIPVRQVMAPDVLGIVPSAPLEIALRMMVEANVRHLPVVERGVCLGLLHEADVLWRLLSGTGKPPLCGAVARTPPPCVSVTDTAHTLALRMKQSASDAVLVLEDGRVVGIVTATDLIDTIAAG